jgi:hypothetical protein
MFISHWIASHSSTPPISSIKSNSPSTACSIWGFQNAQPLHIHPEDGNATFDKSLVNFQHLTRLVPKSQSCTIIIIPHKSFRTLWLAVLASNY